MMKHDYAADTITRIQGHNDIRRVLEAMHQRIKRIEERKPERPNTNVEALARLLQYDVPLQARSADRCWYVLSVYAEDGTLIFDIMEDN